MSDQEFELEKQIANVSQMKFFGKFMDTFYKKKQTADSGATQVSKQAIVKSNQKLVKNEDVYNQSFEKSQDVMSSINVRPEGKMLVEQFNNNRQMNNSLEQFVQIRQTQQKQTKGSRRRQRDFPRPTLKDNTKEKTYNHPAATQNNPINQPPYHSRQQRQQKYFNSDHAFQENPTKNIDQNSYKDKFEQLSINYQEFKSNFISQKRKQKQQLYKHQQTIEKLRSRIYELEVREDELTMENKKLKQKMTRQTRSEKQTQSLKLALESRTEDLRRALEETNYYKGQIQNSRKDFQSISLQNQRYQLELRQYRERLECQLMEIENKESLQKQLSEKISGLIKENARLRDQVSELFRNNKQLQHENYNMKRQVKRGEGAFHPNYNESYTNLRNSIKVQKQEQVEQAPRRPETKRRRGEFNQQRQRLAEKKEQNHRKQAEISKKQSNPLAQLFQNKARLQQEVIQIREQKVLSGAMRRKKIELERDLEKVYVQIEKLGGQRQVRI